MLYQLQRMLKWMQKYINKGMNNMYKVYAKLNDEGYVINLISDCFFEIKEDYIFWNEGSGDRYAYPLNFCELKHNNGTYKYKYENSIFIECEPQEVKISLSENDILNNRVDNVYEELSSLKQENADIYYELMMLSENV